MANKVKLNDILFDIIGNIYFDYSTYMVIVDDNRQLKFLDIRNIDGRTQYVLPNQDYELKANSDIRKLNEKHLIRELVTQLQKKVIDDAFTIEQCTSFLEEQNQFLKEDGIIRNHLYLNLEIDDVLFKQNCYNMLTYYEQKNKKQEIETLNFDEIEILDFIEEVEPVIEVPITTPIAPVEKIEPAPVYWTEDKEFWAEVEQPRINIDEFLQVKKEEKLEATAQIQKANYNKDILFSALSDAKAPMLDKHTLESLYQMDGLTDKQTEIITHQLDLLEGNYQSYYDSPKPIKKRTSLGMAGFTNALILGAITGGFSIICIVYMLINLG